jgi:hypothetical protein
MDKDFFAIQAPSLMRQAWRIDPDHGSLVAYVGHLVPIKEMNDVPDEQVFDYFATRKKAWERRPLPRYVTIGEDRKTVYHWPIGWFYCRRFAFGRMVRRVGRIEDRQLILDGHHFLAQLQVRVPR